MRSHSLAGLLSVGALLAVAACQGEDTAHEPAPEQTPEPVPAADLATVPPPTAPDELADLLTERMARAHTVSVSVELAPDSADATVVESTDVDLRLDEPPAARMRIVESDKETPTTTNIVVADGVIYTELEGQRIVEGKPWMRLSREEVAEVEEELGPFAQIFTTILEETETALAQASGDNGLALIRHSEGFEGPTAEDGHSGYSGTTATRDLADAGEEMFGDLADEGLETVAWSTTVTDKGLPHTLTTEIRTPDGEPATSTVTFTDWGEDVEISPPPSAEVAGLREALEN